MIYFSALIFFLIGAAAWRVRGQHEPWGDTVARYIVWGVPVGLQVLFFTHNFVYAIPAVIFAGIGATLGYRGQFDFSAPGNYNIANYAKLTITAMFRFVPLALAAIQVGYFWHVLPAVIAGISFVPIYILAFTKLNKLDLGPYLNQPSAFGEALFGGTIYLALAIGLYV